MRLFVAISPPPSALQDLRAAVTAASTASGVDGAVRWAPLEQWHLTLGFLGEVAERQQSRLEPRLGRAAGRCPPLALQLRGAGGFGSAARARVLWVGVGGDVGPLRRLAEAVAAASRRSGIEISTRRWRAHLTVARCREPVDARAFVQVLSAYAGPEWTAREITLVRSHLGEGPGGRAVHEPVGGWALEGGQGGPAGARRGPASADGTH